MATKTKVIQVINGSLTLEATIEGKDCSLKATHDTSKQVIMEAHVLYSHSREFSNTLLAFEMEARQRIIDNSSLDWPFDLAGWE